MASSLPTRPKFLVAKTCPRCCLLKVSTEFGSDKRRPILRRSWCKQCHVASTLEHRQKPEHRDRILAYHREYNARPEVKERNAKWREDNRETLLVKQRARWASGPKKAYDRDYYLRNREKIKMQGRRTALLRKYGISTNDYDEMLQRQNGCCAICGTNNPGVRGVFDVDHSHETGKVRGLLCSGCNRGIGGLKDNPSVIEAALSYLQEK